jgi:hypothetical protein
MTRRSRLPAIVALTSLALLALAAPRDVVACSCLETQPMAVYAGEPETVVFTGITEPRDGRGFPVAVTRWFKGDGAAPRVWMLASGFDGNSASCGLEPLALGSEWIFVAYRLPDGGDLIVNLCAPHERLASPAGQAMLADAMATFSGVRTPASTLPPTGVAAETGTDGDDVTAILPAILATILMSMTLILGVSAIAGLRRAG